MDIDILLWLQGIREASSPIVQALFSFLGSDYALAVAVVIPSLAYWCWDKRRAMLALFAYSTSSVFNQLLKNTVCCYRPWIRDARIHPDPKALPAATGYSFPSGHSQSSASLLGGLGWAWRERRWALPAAMVFALLVGFSRNFLGVHAPQDVLVGLLEGTLFVWVGSALLEWAEGAKGRDLRLIVLTLVVLVVYLAYVTLKPYPLDYVNGELLVDPDEMLVDCYKTAGGLLGTMTGWFVERRWVRFEVGKPGIAESAARMLVGLAVIGVSFLLCGRLFVSLMGPLAGQIFRFGVPFFIAIALVPLAFAPMGAFFAKRGRAQGSR